MFLVAACGLDLWRETICVVSFFMWTCMCMSRGGFGVDGFSLLCLSMFDVRHPRPALLSGTLRTYQRAGCDDDQVTLWCPRGTSISVQLAQYGKSSPAQALCGSSRANSTCLWPSALQVSINITSKSVNFPTFS